MFSFHFIIIQILPSQIVFYVDSLFRYFSFQTSAILFILLF